MKIKKIISSILIIATIVSTFCVGSVSVFAASTFTSKNTEPCSSDYVYWNEAKKSMVKSKNMTSSKIGYIQEFLNWCLATGKISNENLKKYGASRLIIDKSYGPASSRLCQAYQKQYSLEPDAKFGSKSIQMMKALISAAKSTTISKQENPRNQSTSANKTIDNPSISKHNYLQVSGDWALSKKYNNSYLRDSGCGILSIVNAVYNCTGNFINPITIADWAYSNKFFNQNKNGGGGICSNTVFSKSATKFGEQYNFKYVSSGTSINSDTLKKHLQNGGTAVIHVPGHYMTLVDFNNGKYLLFDSAPGSGTNYNSIKRRNLTSPNGDWKTPSQLSSGNLKVDGYWLFAAK